MLRTERVNSKFPKREESVGIELCRSVESM
jgi:hypothetical protein